MSTGNAGEGLTLNNGARLPKKDLDTLRLIKSYRGQRESDGAILFGVYGSVLQPGRVRVGDAFEPLE